MFWVRSLLILVPLLNVLAAEAYVGNGRSWSSRDLNFRRPMTAKPNPIHDFSKPISQPTELQPNVVIPEEPTTPETIYVETHRPEVLIPPNARTFYRGRSDLPQQQHPALPARRPAEIHPQPRVITPEPVAVPEPPRTISAAAITPLEEVVVTQAPPAPIPNALPQRHFLLPVPRSRSAFIEDAAGLQSDSEIITLVAEKEEESEQVVPGPDQNLVVEPSQPPMEESKPVIIEIITPSPTLLDNVPTAPVNSDSETPPHSVAPPTIEEPLVVDVPDKEVPAPVEDQPSAVVDAEIPLLLPSAVQDDVIVVLPTSNEPALTSSYRFLLPPTRTLLPQQPSSDKPITPVTSAKPPSFSRSLLPLRTTVLPGSPPSTRYLVPRVSPTKPPPALPVLPLQTTALPEVPSSTSYPTPPVSLPTASIPLRVPVVPPTIAIETPVKPPTWGRSITPDSRSNSPTVGPTQLLDYQCGQSDTYHSMANDCDSYVECKSNIAFLFTCPDGLHFNPRAVWPEYPCAYPSEVKCDASSVRREPQPTEECPRQYGFFAMSDSDCSKYVMCQEGLATIMNCPPGLVFNAKSSNCDWPENVPSCNPDIFRGFSCPAPPLEEDGRPSDMIFKYRFNGSCKEYVACQRGHPRLLRCDAGLSFSEESQVCIDTGLVPNCYAY